MAQMRIFVSHSHNNNPFCEKLVRALRRAGADVWYDDESLQTGQLGPIIERELRERPVFVVVLSPAALASRWVEDETRWAYNRLRRDPTRIILPVLAEALPDADDIWLFLQDFKRIEAPGPACQPHPQAVTRTLHALQLTLPGETPLPTAAQPAESADDLLTRGKALQAQGKHAEALPLFQRATQLDRRSFSAWFNVGYTLSELERYDEALAAYDRALTLDPNEALAWINKGLALNKLERYEEALVALDRALALDPNEALAWYNKGTALNGLKRYAEALAAFERGFDPNDARDWGNKGNALRGLTRYEEALAAYDRALALGKTALRWNNKAATLRALGRTREAEQAERRARELG